MSTITEPSPRCATSLLAALGLALAGWFGILIASPILARAPAPVTLLAVSEQAAYRAISRADVDILAGNGRVFTVRGRASGAIARLYAAGGVVVLAANGEGCRGRI